MGEIANEADTGISSGITSAIQGSGAFEITSNQPQMAVLGEVLVNNIGQEQTGSAPYTCHRQVPEQRTRQVPVFIPQAPVTSGTYTYTPPPRMEMRTETYTEMVDHPYSCTQLLRWINASFHVHLRVNARTRPIQIVMDREFDLDDEERTTGLRGSDSDDHEPPLVDGPGLLRSLHQRAVSAFAEAALPRSDSVSIDFANCHEDACENGIQLVRNSDIAGAIRLFGTVVDRYANPTTTGQRERLAAALFNRGVLNGYGGEFEVGIADVSRAITLNAEIPDWNRHLAAIRRLQAERQASTFRGETPDAPTPDHEAPPPVRRRPAPSRRPAR